MMSEGISQIRSAGCFFVDMFSQVVMGRTLFYRPLNELEHHFSNIQRTQTCSSIDDRTRTPKFWLQMNGHRILNLKGRH